ncbi:MAG TPA: class I SAM-dependent methyltransferase [Lachnospiraceae bacterium]
MDSIDYYNQNASAYYDKTVHVDMAKIMQPFINLLPENAELLDMGCGSGRDTLALEEAGFSVTAMDGAIEMCRLAEIYTDKEILHLTYEEMDFLNVFDGIWACASLVHIPYKKMPQILGKMVDALVKDGLIYLSLREGERSGWDGLREYYDYNEEVLLNLLGNIPGIAIVDIWKTLPLIEDDNPAMWWNIILRKG